MFDAKKEIEEITGWLRDWFSQNGSTAQAVIGISGGKDSAVCAALLCRALGKERVTAVLMPDGTQSDIADSYKVIAHLGLQAMEINIGTTVRALSGALSKELSLSTDAKINLPPRIRMATLYAVAQSLPSGGRVANTCNGSEDYIGYSTKYGDAAGDFGILADYTVTEVLQIGDALRIPTELVHKAPSDGLSGKTDEDKIGFSYAVLDRYIREGVCAEEEIKEKIDRMHRQNLHKLKEIPSYRRQQLL